MKFKTSSRVIIGLGILVAVYAAAVPLDETIVGLDGSHYSVFDQHDDEQHEDHDEYHHDEHQQDDPHDLHHPTDVFHREPTHVAHSAFIESPAPIAHDEHYDHVVHMNAPANIDEHDEHDEHHDEHHDVHHEDHEEHHDEHHDDEHHEDHAIFHHPVYTLNQDDEHDEHDEHEDDGEPKRCTTCQSIIQKIDGVVESAPLQQRIIGYLEQGLCGLVPSNEQAKCNQTVEQHVPEMMSSFVHRFLDPQEDCEAMHLCHTDDDGLPSLNGQQMTVSHLNGNSINSFMALGNEHMADNSLLCDTCNVIVGYITGHIMENPEVVTYIEQSATNICNELPPTIGNICSSNVNTTIPKMVSYVASYLNHNACAAIGACPADTENLLVGHFADTAFNRVWNSFQAFIEKYNRVYATVNEALSRFEVYAENWRFVHSENSNITTYALNEMADRLPGEHKWGTDNCYLNITEGSNLQCQAASAADSFVNMTDLPKSVDWRDKNVVTPVKDQGQCGSCWSFSATGAMEGAYALAKGELKSFSEQELVDCSKNYGNQGCEGGLMDQAFKFAIDNGMCTEKDDPYVASETSCKTCNNPTKFSGCFDVMPNDEDALMRAVAKQPVAVAIEADQQAFMFYTGGIIDTENCGTNLDHGVLIVGYGEEDGHKYWLVKNSWGTQWGEKGYVRIARASKEDQGMCGIAMQPSYIVA